MFTLKLFRRHPESTGTPGTMRKVIAVDRVVLIDIGTKKQALEVWAFKDRSNDYDTYYIGKPEEGMDAFGKEDLHLGVDPMSWWQWGLLENWEGNTTEHYRPHTVG